MLFYKYQKPGVLEFSMLRRGEIYFASVSELNDSNECRPHLVLKGSTALWQRLGEFVIVEACLSSEYFWNRHEDMIRPLANLGYNLGVHLKKRARMRDLGTEEFGNLFIELLEPTVRDKFPAFQIQEISQVVSEFIRHRLPRLLVDDRYMCSFSRVATNPTMWGHYAAAERGFVVVYGTDDEKISVRSDIPIIWGSRPSTNHPGVTELGIYKEERLELLNVKYGRKPPKVNAFHRLIHKFSYSEEEDHYDVPLLLAGDAAEKEEEMLGLVKFSDWKYERELRAFFPMSILHRPPSDVRVLRISTEHIKGIIFGPQMSEEDKKRAVICGHILKESNTSQNLRSNDIGIFQATRVTDRFGFDIVPLGMVGGNYSDHFLPFIRKDQLDPPKAKLMADLASSISR